MSPRPRYPLLAAAFALGSQLAPAPPLLAQGLTADPALPPEARQFDFWVGEWAVNLRVLQDDATWEDERRAVAEIHPILKGKAVLELWDEEAIKGFSLRYFEPGRDRWVLWLNWPNATSSGASSLEGAFRHGRGEFFARGRTADGAERVTRFTFSDISPNSLRWDDAFSSDGGRTWTHSWIMEFSRTGDRPSLPGAGGPAHTWVDGDRCTAPQLAAIQGLQGRWAADADASGSLAGYGVLDGCALILMMGEGVAGQEDWFAHLTWNTRLSRLELLELDAGPGTPARLLYGAEGSTDLVFYEVGEVPPARMRIERESHTVRLLWEERSGAGDVWEVMRSRRFAGSGSPDG